MTLSRFTFWHLLSIVLFTIGFWFVSVHAAHAALTQNDYRFYVNTNAQAPSDPWPSGATDLGENTSAAGANALQQGDKIRIRMNVNATTENESGHTMKLQYKQGGICSSGVWSDVGGLGSATIWRGFDNAGVTDGSTLTSTLLGASDAAQTYEEANNSATMPNPINVGQDGEWDWVVENNGAPEGTTYCFRMVKSDGSALTGYDDYPKLVTKAFLPKSRNWHWYDNETLETPDVPLAGENIQPFGQPIEDPIKLRLTVNEVGAIQGTDQKFSLEFSTVSNFTSGVETVTESGSCTSASKWCYANGVDADNDAIINLLLTDSSVKGTHNESGTSSTTFDHPASSAVEYEFTIQSRAGVSKGMVYYFRAYDQVRLAPVPLGLGETYPNIKTRQTTLTFTVQGLASGTVIDTHTTNVTTTATTIPFGTLIPNAAKIGAHRLTVSQDGEGYIVYLKSDGQLRTGSLEIDPISGTNASPSAWTFNVNSQTGLTGAFGYHPDDDVLSASSTRFQNNDTWAQVETTRKEIISTDGPLLNDVHDVLFQVETGPLQSEGIYTAEIQYIVVPTY